MPHLEEVKALARLPFSSYDRNKFEFPKEHYSKKKVFLCPNPAHFIKTLFDSL